jgi:hypothetical protein
MKSKKRTLRAGGARGSRKHPKKRRTRSRKSKRTQPFSPRTQCWMYAGTEMLATLITTHTGVTRVFGSDRRPLGRFSTFASALAAINAGVR